MKKYQEIYEDNFEATIDNFSRITKELQILDIFETSINQFISTKIKNLDKGGRVFISRFNARNIQQDAFHIHFCPASEDKKSYIQCNLATGYILDKKLIFEYDSNLPEYVIDNYIYVIADIFRDFGFSIEFYDKKHRNWGNTIIRKNKYE